MSVTQTGASGDAETVVTATAVTAARRTTWSVDDEPMPTVRTPGEVNPYTVPSPVEWIRRYEMRPIEGAIPHTWDGSGSDSRSRLWMRDAAPRPLDLCGLAALADVFFPRVWLRRATRVPAGTVSMTVYFHAGSAQLAEVGHGWVLGQARAQAFRNGFFDQTALLWSEAGHLLCSSHQVVYYKE
jgi:acyl-CoA thioesterase